MVATQAAVAEAGKGKEEKGKEGCASHHKKEEEEKKRNGREGEVFF